MIILEEQQGLGAGLNRGLKIGRALKKNFRLRNVSIKNAIKVGKVAIPLATTAMSLIPGGGIASKILDSKVGKIFTKVKDGKVVRAITKAAGTKVGQFAIKNVIKPTIKNAISGGAVQEPVYDDSQMYQSDVMDNATPTPAQIETIAQVKGVAPQSITSPSEGVPTQAQVEAISKIKDIPVEDIKQEVATVSQNSKEESAKGDDKPNYTLPIVIGVGALGVILLASKSN